MTWESTKGCGFQLLWTQNEFPFSLGFGKERRPWLDSVSLWLPMGLTHGCLTLEPIPVPRRRPLRGQLVQRKGPPWEVETSASDPRVSAEGHRHNRERSHVRAIIKHYGVSFPLVFLFLFFLN